jgi:hypothetical protein
MEEIEMMQVEWKRHIYEGSNPEREIGKKK